MMRRTLLSIATATLVAGPATVYAQDANIVETASEIGTFSTLLSLAEAAGMLDTLQSDGPITLFAPTDAAFGELPASALQALMKDENLAQLQAILSYHVVPGLLLSGDLADGSEAATAEGSVLLVSVGDAITVSGAEIVEADVLASNGVIHVIDSVLIPASAL